MNTKYKVVASGLLSSVLVLGLLTSKGEREEPRTIIQTSASREEQTEIDTESLGAVLFTLAAERYADTTKRGEIWILATHVWFDNTNVLKVSDQKFTIVSFPVIEPELLGFSQYTDHYNTFNVMAADSLLKKGKTNEAQHFYEVLLHYSHKGNFAESLRARLAWLERLRKGDTNGTDLNPYIAESAKIGPITKLSGIQDKHAQIVTNLLLIDLERFAFEQNTNK